MKKTEASKAHCFVTAVEAVIMSEMAELDILNYFPCNLDFLYLPNQVKESFSTAFNIKDTHK